MSYTVTYNANGATGGSIPVDNNTYATGAVVTVLGNTGNLVKGSDTFARWNTAADGTGTPYGSLASGTITIGTTNVILYAQWYTTSGLTNNGLTTHYQFFYESSLQGIGVEPTRTNGLINNIGGNPVCENDYQIMLGWFGGTLTLNAVIPVPISVYVANLGSPSSTGANTGSTITLRPFHNNTDFLRYLIVSEVTEIFMHAQNQGWFAPDGSNEQSCGEGLSRFLAQQFLVSAGIGIIEPGYAISPSWLNSSLPTTNSSSTPLAGSPFMTLSAAVDNVTNSIPVVQATTVPFASSFIIQIDSEQMLVTTVNMIANTLTVTRSYNGTSAAAHSDGANVVQNYGSRADYVNVTLEYDHGIDAATGCAMLFLYYLQVQLGFTPNQIIAAAPGVGNAATCLRGVYQSLTKDTSDPFPFFKQLLDDAFPPDQVANIPGPNPDNPWPLGELSFWVEKSSFGKDEATDSLTTIPPGFPSFLLVIEGFNRQVFSSGSTLPLPTFSGQATSSPFPGITLSPDPSGIIYELPGNFFAPQRISLAYDVAFNQTSINDWPAAVSQLELDASITVAGATVPFTASTILEFVPGADPYFTNVNPAQDNVPWLSQDLRVFTATPTQHQTPIQGQGAPAFTNHSYKGAYSYCQSVITYLNTQFGNPIGPNGDPFTNGVLPSPQTAYTADSSVTPGTLTDPNYNFAIARVRLRGPVNEKATNVKVFFRLWASQVMDTDYQLSTYPSQIDATTGLPDWPLPTSTLHTIPFFATANVPDFSSPSDPEFGTAVPTNVNPTGTGYNNQTIVVQSGDYQWAYFGCFLNIYDQTNLFNGSSILSQLPSGHHCLVAQIAFDGAPIPIGITTGDSDKLAQRNLQVTTSNNPGSPASHTIPQTFDVVPTTLLVDSTSFDELMIEWGNTPNGSTASIYWPQVTAADVIQLASQRYATQLLSTSDAHTIECTVQSPGVTYIPIPSSAGPNFAGLFTIDLPSTVVKGQEFNIIVRRVSSKSFVIQPTPPPPQIRVAKMASITPLATTSGNTLSWRYIVGAFQVKVPVSTAADILPDEENALAIFRWRLEQMSPINRWYPVLERYVDYIAARVSGLGGNPVNIPASPLGAPPSTHRPKKNEICGRVCEVFFDSCGKFEGFIIKSDSGKHTIKSCHKAVMELALAACKEQLVVCIRMHGHGEHARIVKIMIRAEEWEE